MNRGHAQRGKSSAGMELLGPALAGGTHAAQEMNAQMTSLVETLRATQNRAEQRILAALEQQRVPDGLDAYAKKLPAQGRSTINSSEQKHWSIAAELNKARSDTARAETESERKVRVTLTE